MINRESIQQNWRSESADTPQARYRALCRRDPDLLPIYDRDWWLDAVCGGSDRWDVALVERGGEIVASLPYFKRRKSVFQTISMPELTLTSGIWMRYPEEASAADKLAWEREVHLDLIGQLPRVDFFHQQIHGDMTNWSTFYWHGYRQMSRFTYVLEDTSDASRLYDQFSEFAKSDIAKAERQLTVVVGDEIDKFQDVNRTTFDPPRFTMPYTLETLQAVDRACRARSCRQILLAEDAHGRPHCALYLVWDRRVTYCLLGGETPMSKTSGAHALLFWHAIREAARRGHSFDFCGGMHEPAERLYRSFGATQKTYHQLTKVNGKLFKLAYYLKQAIR